MAGPTAVFVLDAVEVLTNRFIPRFPLDSTFSEQRFADIHVAKKFFAAVVAEAGDELLIVQAFQDATRRRVAGLLQTAGAIDDNGGFIFGFFARFFVGQNF